MEEIIYILVMNSLKKALSTEGQKTSDRDKVGANESLLKGVNKSKSHSIWALDMDEGGKTAEQTLNNDGLLRILNQKLQACFKKDGKAISEVAFERIIEEFQDEAGGSKTELTYLMVIEDKLADIQEFARQDLKPFLDIFSSMLEAKISKLRKREKKTELNNFQQIVNSNFKKKTNEKAYLHMEEEKKPPKRLDKVRKESESERRESGSADKKLNRLFSKQKNPIKQREGKDSAKKDDEQPVYNATSTFNHDESISFSAALATTMTVKTRKRKSSTEKKQKAKKHEQGKDEREQGDEAFMFFRPKKHKK